MNRLVLRLMGTMTQTQLLICGVCKQPIDPTDQTPVKEVLFGSVKYGVCCCCFQEVEPPHGMAYKVRWGRHFRGKQSKRKTEEI